MPVLASVKRDALCDVALSRFLHSQAQARLALMKTACVLPVELEPTKASDGPGDAPIGPVFIEAVTFTEDQKLQDYKRFCENCRAHLFTLDKGRDIYWKDGFPELLNGDVFEKEEEVAAQRCAASGAAVEADEPADRRASGTRTRQGRLRAAGRMVRGEPRRWRSGRGCRRRRLGRPATGTWRDCPGPARSG